MAPSKHPVEGGLAAHRITGFRKGMGLDNCRDRVRAARCAILHIRP